MGKVTVVGGAGFLGRYLVKRLAQQGFQVCAAVRDPEAVGHLKPMGEVGQVQSIQANIRNAASIARAVAGADVVVNLTGVMFPRGAQSFQAVHVEGAATVAGEYDGQVVVIVAVAIGNTAAVNDHRVVEE